MAERDFDPLSRGRQLFFGVPESQDHEINSSAKSDEGAVNERDLTMQGTQDSNWPEDTTNKVREKRVSSSHNLSQVIGREAVGKLVMRKGTAEERRLRALRRISGREFD